MASYRKRRNKDGSFSHQFRIRRHGFPLITKTFDRKVDGEAWVQDTESAMRAGRFVDTRAAKEMTVSELIDLYTQSSHFQARRSQHSPLQTLDWWKARIGRLSVAHVIRPLLKQHWLDLAKTPSERTGRLLTNRTLNGYLETLSACFSFAVEEELVDDNPVWKIKRKPLNNSRERVLSKEELEGLLEAARASSNKYLRTAILLSLSTGGRRSEVLGLSWDDVNLQTGEVRFRVTKNGRPRTTVLGSTALAALREHSKLRSLQNALLFPPLKPRRDGLNHVAWEDLTAPFRRACKVAGIKDFRWHDLRHSAASFLMMSGASIEEAMKVLGHRSFAMSWRYAHLDQRRTAELTGKVDRNFLSQKEAA